MGYGKDFLEERIKCEMSKDTYEQLPEYLLEKIQLKSVDVDGMDYSDDEIWQQLKKESIKAYKKLKEREYDLRHI